MASKMGVAGWNAHQSKACGVSSRYSKTTP